MAASVHVGLARQSLTPVQRESDALHADPDPAHCHHAVAS